MIAILLALASWPQCVASAEPLEWPWASSRCEASLPALAQLAGQAVEHGSVPTYAWARAALAERTARCPGVFTPVVNWHSPGPQEPDSWRWLADVGARDEARSLIASRLRRSGAHWSWAFAWVELTREPCPGSARSCAVFRALRDGDWATLRGTAKDLNGREGVLLEALALEQTGAHAAAVALLEANPRQRAFNTHPLTDALETMGARIRTGERLDERCEAVDALEPGHALRALTHSPPARVPLADEHFTPLFAD